MSGYRYGPYTGGPDPLEPPYDVRGAVDAMGESVLDGTDPASALRDLLRRGMSGHRGLDDLLRRVRERQREIRGRGRLDGILDEVRALLDTAIGQERAELFPNPDDSARLREAELDALPSDTAQAIRELADYEWQSAAARATFEQLKSLLRSEVLDSQFRGMRETLANPDPEALQRVKDMMAALNNMLDADARGEHTQQDFDDFMSRFGDMFPDAPANLEELVDALVRRMSAAQRLLDSLTDEQRDELAGLMAQALDDAGLAAEMARLSDSLRARRPDMDEGWPQPGMTGSDPLGLSDATTALAELADLGDLEDSLRQDYPGARLDDVDEEAIRRALGRQAVDDMEALRQIERELEQQGYLQRVDGKLELTPKAVRRLGQTALRKVFAQLPEGGTGDHDQRDAGRPASTPAAPGRGGSATSRQSMPPQRCETRCSGRRHHGSSSWTGPARREPPARSGAGVRSGSRLRTSRWPRPTAALRRPSACWSTCRTRWRCAGPGERRSRQRSRCMHSSGPSTRRTRSRSSASPTTPANFGRPNSPG